MPRVLLLSTDLERGGYPLRIARTARCLQGVGFEPIVGCLSPAGPVGDELEGAGIETIACDARGRFDVGCLRRLAGHIRRLDPDLIHSGLFHANLAARLIGRLDRWRPIITSTATIEIERRWHLWLEALTGGISDLHLVNSSAVADHVVRDLGFRSSHVVVWPNGLDISAIDETPPADRAEFGIGDAEKLVVWAGRFDRVKDLPTWLRSIDRVRRVLPVRGLLIGDGAERPRIQRTVREMGLESVVVLAGWRGDVVSWLKAADVLLFPSRTEGSPNTILEAMACECPVVASDIPACRSLLVPGDEGWLCPSGDESGFAHALLGVLTDPGEGARRSSEARRRVCRDHSLRDVVAWLAGHYHRVLLATASVR